jgi:hypothetical protein
LKSVAGATLTPTEVVYDLKAEAYDALRRATRDGPASSCCSCLRRAPADWLDHTEDRLALCGCAYWLSLRGSAGQPEPSSCGYDSASRISSRRPHWTG